MQDDFFIKVYAQLVKNHFSKKLCIKSHLFLSSQMRRFINAFPTSNNLFIYRNPYDVYLSNLEGTYFAKDSFSKDSERLQELLKFGHVIIEIYKEALKLFHEKN